MLFLATLPLNVMPLVLDFCGFNLVLFRFAILVILLTCYHDDDFLISVDKS